ncbi:hypothetical protein BJ165DRAFT_1307795, partial [Panaeolus papilionaceus]
RPEEVGIWVKRHKNKKTDAITVDTHAYAAQFNLWWRALQPEWRCPGTDTAVLSRACPDHETWVSLLKGGNTGIHVILMALSWW